jgi:hypothetical protein
MYRQPGGSQVREMLERGLDSERGGRLLGGRGRVGNKGLGQRARIDIPAGLYCSGAVSWCSGESKRLDVELGEGGRSVWKRRTYGS